MQRNAAAGVLLYFCACTLGLAVVLGGPDGAAIKHNRHGRDSS